MSNKEALIGISKIIGRIKLTFYSIEEPDKLLEFINNNIKPTTENKKSRGEVFTPMALVNDMLNKLPEEVWTNKNLKWLDPAAGMGNFPIAVYLRLFKSLKQEIKDDEERRKHILEKMVYMVEIDKYNVFMIKKILCGHKYKLNIFKGSFIEGEKYPKVYKPDLKFDVIMGNPPYQEKTSSKTYYSIWDKFLLLALNYYLNNNGLLLFINPSGWRDISGLFLNIKLAIYDKNLLYLEIHNEKDGIKVFNSSTRYDIIVIKNEIVTKTNTKIVFQDKKEKIIDIKKLLFIPNGNFDFIYKLIAKNNEKKINLLYDSCSYHTQKKWMSNIKTPIYKYHCVYTVNINNIATFKYSSIKFIKDIKLKEKKCLNKSIEHFNIPKLIWGNGNTGFFIDKKGDCGLTEYAYAIIEKNIEKLKLMEKILKTNQFKRIMNDCSVKKASINYKVFALFKEDFYKYFLDKPKK